MKISGEFEARLKPMDTHADGADGVTLGRMSIDKTYSGDLAATSSGEMLTAMTSVKGAAGYVAIEHVAGTLAGKSGSFALQHYGTMNAGQEFLLLEVVPESGAGKLAGLTGKMAIRIEDGQHFYDFDFELKD